MDSAQIRDRLLCCLDGRSGFVDLSLKLVQLGGRGRADAGVCRAYGLGYLVTAARLGDASTCASLLFIRLFILLFLRR